MTYTKKNEKDNYMKMVQVKRWSFQTKVMSIFLRTRGMGMNLVSLDAWIISVLYET